MFDDFCWFRILVTMNCHITYTYFPCAFGQSLFGFVPWPCGCPRSRCELAEQQMLTFPCRIRAVVPVVLLRPGPGRLGTLVQIDGHPGQPGG